MCVKKIYIEIYINRDIFYSSGLLFEGEIRERMGTVEVQDQVEAVRHCVQQGFVDPARVAVTGNAHCTHTRTHTHTQKHTHTYGHCGSARSGGGGAALCAAGLC